MKRFFTLILLAVLLLTAASCGSAQESPSAVADKSERTAAYQEQCLDALDGAIIQGAAYTTVNGEEVFSFAVGKADKTAGIDNTVDTVFAFASVTKQFTAAAIMLLYEENKLSLDDTIDKYFPDYPYAKEITVHMLLSMRAGIPDYINADEEGMFADSDIPFDIAKEKSAAENRAAIETWLFSQELSFTPDSDYAYCNSCYLLLGEIIEQVSGMSYQEYLTQNLLEPLGMTTAGFCDTYDNSDAVIAKAYARGEGSEWTEYPGVRFGCGDLLCSPKDMAKWANALIDGRVVSADSWEKMTAPYSQADEDSLSYGYGLAVGETEEGDKVVCHSGHFPSYYSMVLMLPAHSYAGVTVSNHSDTAAVGVCASLMKIYRNNFSQE